MNPSNKKSQSQDQVYLYLILKKTTKFTLAEPEDDPMENTLSTTSLVNSS